jgi:hypothetical protein
MFTLRYLLITAIMCISLAACQKPMGMTSDLNVGQYKISMLDIQPATPEMSDNPEYWAIKKLLLANLQQRLPHIGRPPYVGLKISVTEVNTSINAAKAVLIGDNYVLRAKVQLWDLKTNRQLGKTEVFAGSEGTAGLLGLAIHGANVSMSDLEKELADKFTDKLVKVLYPATK